MSDHQNTNLEGLLQQAVGALRQTDVPHGPSPQDVTELVATLEKAAPQPNTFTLKKRIFTMKPITKIAVAATILVASGIIVSWIVIGGGLTNIAFAQVADALDSLRSATFDITTEAKGEKGQPSATATGKGFFLAPSLQRTETKVATGPAKNVMDQIMIVDGQEAKFLILMPQTKLAVAVDMKKMREDMKKSGKLDKGAPPDLFETVRRLVREGSSGTGEKVERLGRKEIDGRKAVGFRVQANMMDMTLWADPETAWPIRIEVGMDMMDGVHMVMNNFHYNVDLDPSLFSLKPPAGYSTQAMDVTTPVEEDLLRTLRTVAEYRKGEFPAKLGMNQEVMKALMEVIKPEMKKLAEKYGGEEKLEAKYGNKPPPAIIAEATKTIAPLMQKQMQGITFYMMLKPENDSHYVGGGVKLGTPDRPILWYKPTGADKYRVIYADLSVKEVAPEELKGFPEAGDP